MTSRLAADAVVAAHLAFVLFVVLGGFLAWRWRRLAVLHLPAAVWGALIELGWWTCPLTPLENALRRRAGAAGYAGGFVEHWIVPAVYPPGITPGVQAALGAAVVLVNVAAYAVYWARRPVPPASPRGP